MTKDESSAKRKSGKRKKEEADGEQDYERLPRKLFAADSNKSMKMILPIKTKTRVVPQMVQEDEGIANIAPDKRGVHM